MPSWVHRPVELGSRLAILAAVVGAAVCSRGTSVASALIQLGSAANPTCVASNPTRVVAEPNPGEVGAATARKCRVGFTGPPSWVRRRIRASECLVSVAAVRAVGLSGRLVCRFRRWSVVRGASRPWPTLLRRRSDRSPGENPTAEGRPRRGSTSSLRCRPPRAVDRWW